MRLRSGVIGIICTLLIFTFIWSNGQQTSRTQLENRRAELLKEIAATQQQLEETKRNRNATLGELRAMKAKLNARQKLINTINTELSGIENNIHTSSSEIQKLNATLDQLRSRYAQSVRYAYKNRESQNMIAFLFSSSDFNEALRRLQYLKKYRDFRKSEADKIVMTQEHMQQKIKVLSVQKNEKSKLLMAEESQRKQIQEETEQTNKVVEELKGREGELLSIIKKNQQANKRIEASIKEHIRKELELARKKAEEEARRKAAAEELARKKAAEEEARRKALAAAENSRSESTYGTGSQTVALNVGKSETKTEKPTQPTEKSIAASTPPAKAAEPKEATVKSSEATKSDYRLSLTPEVQALSNSFAANQGKLPWPVEKGFISGQYGKHPHPLYPSVTMDNNGIDIGTSEGASVRAVFEGTVTKIANIDGSIMVMIAHGEYFTVYTKLANALVKTGDKVSLKQPIGRAGRNEEGSNMLNFQIWKITGNNFSTVNPSSWIAR